MNYQNELEDLKERLYLGEITKEQYDWELQKLEEMDDDG